MAWPLRTSCCERPSQPWMSQFSIITEHTLRWQFAKNWKQAVSQRKTLWSCSIHLNPSMLILWLAPGGARTSITTTPWMDFSIYHWYGKHSKSLEDVHPLIFSRLRGGFARVNPGLMGPALTVPMPRSAMVGRVFQTLLPFVATSRSAARLRMTKYRWQSSATMIYDQLPIHDVFRKTSAVLLRPSARNRIQKFLEDFQIHWAALLLMSGSYSWL